MVSLVYTTAPPKKPSAGLINMWREGKRYLISNPTLQGIAWLVANRCDGGIEMTTSGDRGLQCNSCTCQILLKITQGRHILQDGVFMQNGYIKLHRQLLDNPIMSKPKYLLLWITLLFMANYKEASIIFNNKKLIIPAGSFITGRDQLVKRTGLNRNFIERALKFFESEAQIEQQANPKFRMISITNWAAFQGNEQPASNQRATSEHKQES